MIRMKVHQVNANSVKFKIDDRAQNGVKIGGVVTVSGMYATGLKTLKRGQNVAMAFFIQSDVPDDQLKEVDESATSSSSSVVAQSSDDDNDSSSSPSRGGAKPLNGE